MNLILMLIGKEQILLLIMQVLNNHFVLFKDMLVIVGYQVHLVCQLQIQEIFKLLFLVHQLHFHGEIQVYILLDYVKIIVIIMFLLIIEFQLFQNQIIYQQYYLFIIQPIYASSDRVGDVTISIIEKAVAKFYGCYENLNGGYVHTGLRLLNGYCSDFIPMNNRINYNILQQMQHICHINHQKKLLNILQINSTINHLLVVMHQMKS